MEDVGEKIKGSRFLRDFCAEEGCGEPIRVARVRTADGMRIPNYCYDCRETPKSRKDRHVKGH